MCMSTIMIMMAAGRATVAQKAAAKKLASSERDAGRASNQSRIL